MTSAARAVAARALDVRVEHRFVLLIVQAAADDHDVRGLVAERLRAARRRGRRRRSAA